MKSNQALTNVDGMLRMLRIEVMYHVWAVLQVICVSVLLALCHVGVSHFRVCD